MKGNLILTVPDTARNRKARHEVLKTINRRILFTLRLFLGDIQESSEEEKLR
jgi:hypothetical protein